MILFALLSSFCLLIDASSINHSINRTKTKVDWSIDASIGGLIDTSIDGSIDASINQLAAAPLTLSPGYYQSWPVCNSGSEWQPCDDTAFTYTVTLGAGGPIGAYLIDQSDLELIQLGRAWEYYISYSCTSIRAGATCSFTLQNFNPSKVFLVVNPVGSATAYMDVTYETSYISENGGGGGGSTSSGSKFNILYLIPVFAVVGVVLFALFLYFCCRASTNPSTNVSTGLPASSTHVRTSSASSTSFTELASPRSVGGPDPYKPQPTYQSVNQPVQQWQQPGVVDPYKPQPTFQSINQPAQQWQQSSAPSSYPSFNQAASYEPGQPGYSYPPAQAPQYGRY